MYDSGTTPQRANSFSHLFARLREMIYSVHLQDIFSTALHSRDFDASRAEYITLRMRLLAFLFAVLAPLWIPIDYFVLDSATFSRMLLLRLSFSAALLLLSRWGSEPHNLRLARLRILLFIAIPGLFFLLSHLLLDMGIKENGVLAGYDFLPFLIMALLGVVPLTLLEGLTFCGLLTGFFIITEISGGTLLTLHSLGDLWLLLLLAVIAMWVQMSQLHMLLRLYREATRDALTGLVNRRVLAAHLRQLVSEHSERPLSLLIFDLDLFKRINDTWGHTAGDKVLQAFAEILRRHCRSSDLVGRFGGEEFLAILPDTSLEEAREVAENIRRDCSLSQIRVEGAEQPIQFTTSIGVAERHPGEAADELLSRVDEGLYRAKTAGRDIVSVAA